MTGPEIIDAILGGQADDNIREIFDACNRRTRILSERRARENAATLKGGDRVRTFNLSPKYLNDLTATVESVDPQGRIIVKLDHPESVSSRYARPDGTITVPASCLQAI